MMTNVVLYDFRRLRATDARGVTRRTTMTSKTALILATTAAIALGEFRSATGNCGAGRRPRVVSRTPAQMISARKQAPARAWRESGRSACRDRRDRSATIGGRGRTARARDYYERPYTARDMTRARHAYRCHRPYCSTICAAQAYQHHYAPGPRVAATPTDSSAVRCRANPASIRPLLRGPIAIRRRRRPHVGSCAWLAKRRPEGRRSGPLATLTAKMLRRKFFC